jgi:predicted DNA-binding protein
VGGTKNILLRLDSELAERLGAVAQVEGRPVSGVVRDAIARYVDERRQDPEFRRQLRDSLSRHADVLRLLADDE